MTECSEERRTVAVIEFGSRRLELKRSLSFVVYHEPTARLLALLGSAQTKRLAHIAEIRGAPEGVTYNLRILYWLVGALQKSRKLHSVLKL